MKILQIVPSISLVYGGPSQMVLGLAEALAQAGVTVTILTTDSNGDVGQAPLDVPLKEPIAQNGYEIIYFRCYPWRRYKFSLDLLLWLNQHAQEFDLAHIHGLFSPVSTCAAWVARQQKLPYIMRPFGTLDRADLQKKKWLKKVYVTLLEKANLAGAKALHFTSENEAQSAEKFGVKTKDLVIPLGVKLAQNLPDKVDRDLPMILFLSRIDRKKGIELLIAALEALLITGYQFQFVLAGSNAQDPEYEREIKAKIEELPHLRSHCQITGFVTGETKINLLQNATIFVLPSYYENFGIAVVEAMAYGLPVIISDRVDIHPAILQAEAGWVCTCDVSDLTAKLAIALTDRVTTAKRGKNAQILVRKNYSWEAIAQTMIESYQQILTI